MTKGRVEGLFPIRLWVVEWGNQNWLDAVALVKKENCWNLLCHACTQGGTKETPLQECLKIGKMKGGKGRRDDT